MALPSVTSRLAGLDLLRATAITLVFFFHYGNIFPHPDWVNRISKFGWTGVDLFFVLSGYLISSELFRQVKSRPNVSVGEFFIKRIFRIMPPYLLVVATYFLLPASRERDTIAPLWKYLTFTQNLGLDLRFQGTFSHAWSLCIEEQFYLALPLLLFAIVRFKIIKYGAALLVLLFLGGFMIRIFCWHLIAPFNGTDEFMVHWHKWIYYPTFCRLDGLLAGVGIGAIFEFRPAWKKWVGMHGNVLLAASLVILSFAYYLCQDEQSFEATVFGFPVVDIGYGVLVLGAISPSGILYRIRSSVMVSIATFSYVIYLTHKIIIHFLQNGLFRMHIARESNLTFLLCSAGYLLAAFIIHKLIENPALKLRNRVLHINKTNGPA